MHIGNGRTIRRSNAAAVIIFAMCGALGCDTPPAMPHAAPSPRVDTAWLLASDVHFNPFDDPTIVAALARAPAAQWHAIFERAAAAPSPYFSDTNYALLRSALAAMRVQAPAPPVVALAGDFLAHGFPEQFAHALPGRSQSDYEGFVDKTLAFLAAEFDAGFPHAQFIVTLGNNDGYCGDYRSTPHSPFLQHMADAWAPLVDRAGSAPGFRHDFAAEGYYTAALPADAPSRAQAVVLNDVYWSAKYVDACGAPNSDPGGTEFDWLTRTLAAAPGPYRWLVGHIPPGIDQYSSLRAQRPVTFMQEAYQRRLIAAATNAGAHVATFLLGHVHHASFEIALRADDSGERGGVPALVVPSISAVQGNNPAFETADVDLASGIVRDTTTFVLPLGNPAPQWYRAFDFDTAYGLTALDVANLTRLQRALHDDRALRDAYLTNYNSQSSVAAVVPATWPWYWCADVALLPAEYGACVAAERVAAEGH